MLCIANGNDLYLRSQDWHPSQNFVWKCSKINANTWAGNRYFNIEAAYTCPASTDIDDISTFSFWKESHDDICPVKIQDSYIGANHGFYCVDEITSTEHGMMQEDIGSIWMDAKKRTYCLVKIPDQNTLSFVMFNDVCIATGRMICGNPSGQLVHCSGAIHSTDIRIDSCRGNQLWQSFNHYKANFYANGSLRDFPQKGILHADTFMIETDYDIIYVPAMLEYLMSNVGFNTNESHHSEEICESYLHICVQYEFHRNGSISTYTNLRILKDVDLQFLGLVQSMPFDGDPIAYVPDTIYDQLTQQNDEMLLSFTKDTWTSPQKAPYRYYQFADVTCDKGMALAYDRGYGCGSNETRCKLATHAGMYYTSRKQYPAFFSEIPLHAGDTISGFGAKIPLYRYDEDFTSVCWYWIGEDIVLMLDAHAPVDKWVYLPSYMNGRSVILLDKSDSCSSFQESIADSMLHFSSNQQGYAVLLLCKT